MENSLIQIKKLRWSTPEGRVLGDDLSLNLAPGQLLWIQGPNGSGKSTLLRVLVGDQKPTKGLLSCSVPVRRIGFLPQVQSRECHLPASLGDVIRLAHRQEIPTAQLGLIEEDRLAHAWNQASGGERQRTLLTRELVARPRLLFLDEPLNHLDEFSREVMLKTLSQIFQEPDAPAIVLVSHENTWENLGVRHGGYRLILDGKGGTTLHSIQPYEAPHQGRKP